MTILISSFLIGDKDAEFPNGRPLVIKSRYTTKTDNDGRYTFNFEVKKDWIFFSKLVTGDFIQKSPQESVLFLFSDPAGSLSQAKNLYDTLYGEKPGYIKYHIQNVNDAYDNDTLLVRANSQLGIGLPNGAILATNYQEYNWAFVGKTIDKLIIDTLPAESNQLIPVKWLYKRTDTIILKNETISILPNSTKDYNIQY